MKKLLTSLSAVLALALTSTGTARADSYDDAIHTFKQAGKSGTYFAKAYAYAVFPTVGGAGFVVGAAHGKGRVYARGTLTGDATMNLVSAGVQAGAKAYSEIVSSRTSAHSMSSRAVISSSGRTPVRSPSPRAPKPAPAPPAPAPKPVWTHRMPAPAVAVISTAWQCSRLRKAA